jgi:site-specific DNA-methyltransferase (adenine-specific)
MMEYILIFRKPGPRPIYHSRTSAEKQANRFEIDSVFTKEVANNVWHIAPVPPGQLDHPCPFPEEIPYHLLRLYSYSGDLVLDPFCGVGTTLKVAHALQRNWVGYEVLEKYRTVSLQRIQEPLILRKQLIPEYAKVGYGERLLPTRSANGKKRAPFRRKDKQETEKQAGEDLNLLLFERKNGVSYSVSHEPPLRPLNGCEEADMGSAAASEGEDHAGESSI